MSEQRPGPVLRPRGPLAAGIYWRRRVLVGLVLIALLSLLARSCGGDDPASTTSGTPTPTPVASGTPSATPSTEPSPTSDASPGVAECRPEDIEIGLAVRGESYAAGSPVPVTISVGTRGDGPCRVDIGSSTVQVVVLSGGDRIWARQDCDDKGKEVVTVVPGAPVAADVTWQGRRSAPACPAGQDAAQPGSYRAVVTVLGVSTPEVTFRLR